VISDQSDGEGAPRPAEVQAVLRYLRATGRAVDTWRHLPRRGMAEQRAFLLEQAQPTTACSSTTTSSSNRTWWRACMP
jgi:hypothetical protein